MKVQVDRAADRGAFIDQSQSFNIHMRDVSFEKLTALHFYSWKKGLKTGMYYLRTEGASEAVKFTVVQEVKDTKELKDTKEKKEMKEVKEVKEAKEVKEKVHLETGYIDVNQAKNHAKLMQMLQILNEKDESETSCESCGS
jgi:ribonucleoside-diphosphate reductase subunit M1